MTLGIEKTSYCDAADGFSSMFSLANSTSPRCSSASCSRMGDTARQGPHHGAQKSTTTGLAAPRTSCSKVASVTSRTPAMLATSSGPPEPEQGHLPDRLQHDRAAHLRAADLAVDERDRHLDDAEARPQRAVGRLDLERVAARVDRVEVDPLQHVAPVALEAPREVAHADAEEDLC